MCYLNVFSGSVLGMHTINKLSFFKSHINLNEIKPEEMVYNTVFEIMKQSENSWRLYETNI